MEKNNSALFFTCSLIEFIGRTTKNKRQDVLDYLGKKDVATFSIGSQWKTSAYL